MIREWLSKKTQIEKKNETEIKLKLKICNELQSLLKFFDINQNKRMILEGDFNISFNPFMHNVLKMAKHTLKILRCEHRKIFEICLAILQHA